MHRSFTFTGLSTGIVLAFASGTVLPSVALAQGADTPPTTPAGLSSARYSASGGGIRWQRSSDDRGVRGYEVIRNNTVLGLFDSLSYVDRDLAPATTYSYGVTAIDTAGQRSGRATVRLTTLDAKPATVTDLRANVYSSTAAGLAWDRATTRGVTYEVRRDGTVVATTDGTSYIDRSLHVGRAYHFDIVAINRQGERAPAARVVVRTSGGTTPVPSGPAAPAGLRANVYSGTAGAIAWTRATLAGLRHEVRRDGTVVATTDGTSYVDRSLAPERAYAYEVVAIDRAGRRSAASGVTLTTPEGAAPPPTDNPFATPDPSGTTTLARLGYAAARDLADDLVSATYLELYLDVDEDVGRLYGGPPPSEQIDQEVPRSVTCPGGGTASGSSTFSSDNRWRTIFAFDACVVDGRTLSGALERTQNSFTQGFSGSTLIVDYAFDALTVDAGEAGTLAVTGTASRTMITNGQICIGESGQTWDTSITGTTSIASARIERGGEITTLGDATYSQDDFDREVLEPGVGDSCQGLRKLTFDGAASVQSTRFGGSRATLAKRGEIVRDEREGMSSATATLTADFGDGSTLAVTTTSDEAGEVQVDIVSDGAAVSFTEAYRFEAR